jgi:hypothetical protein
MNLKVAGENVGFFCLDRIVPPIILLFYSLILLNSAQQLAQSVTPIIDNQNLYSGNADLFCLG